MSALLVSIAALDEVPAALAGGADLIDAKNPAQGALGPWPNRDLRRLRETLGPNRRWSVAAGDPPADPRRLRRTLDALPEDIGADFIKIGLHRPADPALWKPIFDALGQWPGRRRLIPVLFADQDHPREVVADLIPRAARIGAAGMMVDTADKTGGRLVDYWDRGRIADFCARIRDHHLVCGLAGSLRIADIPPLIREADPDYLGLRSALCGQGGRTAALRQSHVAQAAAWFNTSEL